MDFVLVKAGKIDKNTVRFDRAVFFFGKSFIIERNIQVCYTDRNYQCRKEKALENEVEQMAAKKIIMDCDPGVDDGIAMALIAAYPEIFQVLAVTTVNGNQTLDKVTKNALDLTEFYGMDVPVAKGMDAPIIREPVYAPDAHGETGLGYCVLAPSSRQTEREQGVLYLQRILTELPEGEKITLLATGPLTNIAMLLKMFPEVKEKIREILFMGGAAQGGNVTSSAEFNIYVDPEAAKIVFKAGIPLVMFGLDVTNRCFLTKNQVMKLSQSPDPVAKACGDMAGYALENENKYRGVVSIHDAAPVMYLLHPEIFKGERAILDVDCSEGISRGRTVCDFRWWSYEPEATNVFVVMDVKEDKFQEYLISALFELGDKAGEKTEKGIEK